MIFKVRVCVLLVHLKTVKQINRRGSVHVVQIVLQLRLVVRSMACCDPAWCRRAIFFVYRVTSRSENTYTIPKHKSDKEKRIDLTENISLSFINDN